MQPANDCGRAVRSGAGGRGCGGGRRGHDPPRPADGGLRRSVEAPFSMTGPQPGSIRGRPAPCGAGIAAPLHVGGAAAGLLRTRPASSSSSATRACSGASSLFARPALARGPRCRSVSSVRCSFCQPLHVGGGCSMSDGQLATHLGQGPTAATAPGPSDTPPRHLLPALRPCWLRSEKLPAHGGGRSRSRSSRAPCAALYSGPVRLERVLEALASSCSRSTCRRTSVRPRRQAVPPPAGQGTASVVAALDLGNFCAAADGRFPLPSGGAERPAGIAAGPSRASTSSLPGRRSPASRPADCARCGCGTARAPRYGCAGHAPRPRRSPSRLAGFWRSLKSRNCSRKRRQTLVLCAFLALASAGLGFAGRLSRRYRQAGLLLRLPRRCFLARPFLEVDAVAVNFWPQS